MAKLKKVELKIKGKEHTVTFEYSHALALLRLQKSQERDDWQVVTKGLEFKDNELIRKRSNKADKSKKEVKPDSTDESLPEQAKSDD
tara:strand:- start:3590 stop:3850 length:261 start_codon:yes stop_codon:yes gene_type:complete